MLGNAGAATLAPSAAGIGSAFSAGATGGGGFASFLSSLGQGAKDFGQGVLSPQYGPVGQRIYGGTGTLGDYIQLYLQSHANRSIGLGPAQGYADNVINRRTSTNYGPFQ